jgi:hypothetical protein
MMIWQVKNLKIKNMHNFMQIWINWLIYGAYKVNK